MVHGFHLTQENVTKKVRILDVVYNATSNELVPCLADVGDSWLILKNGVISKNRTKKLGIIMMCNPDQGHPHWPRMIYIYTCYILIYFVHGFSNSFLTLLTSGWRVMIGILV